MNDWFLEHKKHEGFGSAGPEGQAERAAPGLPAGGRPVPHSVKQKRPFRGRTAVRPLKGRFPTRMPVQISGTRYFSRSSLTQISARLCIQVSQSAIRSFSAAASNC